MIGSGNLYKEVEEYIEQNDLKNVIKITSFLDNPYKYMKNAKVLLMPSIYEGFGLVAVEAMLLGLPVVCFPVGGLKEIINENCGIICKSENDMIEALKKLLINEKLRMDISKFAKNEALKYCNTGLYKMKLEKIYQEIMKG